MKIKDYKLFLESKDVITFEFLTNIESICKKYGIKNYSINDDGSIDVDGNVDLYGYSSLIKLPLKFGRVTGYFNCGHNKLNSLEGSPKFVGGYFSCNNNELITLEGGPKIVIGDYYCKDNYLINFKGFPEDYEGDLEFTRFNKTNSFKLGNPIFDKLKKIPYDKRNKFIYWCNEFDAIDEQGNTIPERMEEVYNKIGLEYDLDNKEYKLPWESLDNKDYKLFLESVVNNASYREYIHSICKQYGIENYSINDDGTVDVDGDVNLYNKGLTKLPLKFGKVTGYFNCSENQLTTLEGSPKWVGGYFSCYNNKLTTLEGGPVTVIDGYYCYDNKLINFKGFPEDYDLYVNFHGNPVFKLFGPIPFEKWDKFIYWCNEYDAIDNDGKVIPERMEEVYQKLGLEYED